VAIALVQAGTAVEANSGTGALITATATLTSAPSSANVLVATVSWFDFNGATGTFTPPTGWNLAFSEIVPSIGSSVFYGGVYYYWITGTTATSFAWKYTGSGSNYTGLYAQVCEYSGTSTTYPILNAKFESLTTGSSQTTLVSPTLTAPVANLFPISFLFYQFLESNSNLGAPSSYSTGWSQLGYVTDGTSGYAECNLTTASGPLTTSGQSVSVTYTYASGKLKSGDVCVFSIALLAPPFTITQVQTASASATSTSMSLVYTNAPTQGNKLLAFVAVDSTSATTGPSGWTKVASDYSSPTGLECWWKDAGAGESATQTWTGISGSHSTVGGFEFANVFTGAPGINATNSSVASTSTLTTGTVTPSDISCLPVAAWMAETNASWTGLTSGWSTAISKTQSSSQSLQICTDGTYTTSTSTAISATNGNGSATHKISLICLLLPAYTVAVSQNGTIAQDAVFSSATVTCTATLPNAPLSTSVVLALVNVVDKNSSYGTITPPSGWTLYDSSVLVESTTSWYAGNYIYWNTSITGTSYNWQYANSASASSNPEEIAVQLFEIVGASTSAPVTADAFTHGAAGTNITSGSITAGSANLRPVAVLNLINSNSVGATPSAYSTGWVGMGNIADWNVVTSSLGPLTTNSQNVSVTYTGATTGSGDGYQFTLLLLTSTSGNHWSVTATDSLGAISETLTSNVSLPRSFSDSLSAITDSVTRSAQVFTRTTSDALAALSDALTRAAQAFTRNLTDSPGAPSESLTRTLSLPRAPADTLGAITDTLSRSAQSFTRTAADSPGVPSDSLTQNVSLPRTVTDSPGGPSEMLTQNVSLPRTSSDTLAAISETLSRGAQAFTRTSSDTLGAITDTLARGAQAFSRSATDTLDALSETLTGGRLLIRTAADTLDAITDTLARGAQAFTRSTTDSLPGISDALSRSAQAFTRTAADALAALSDTLARAAQGFSRSATDPLDAPSDTLTRGAQTFTRSATDTLPGIAESLTRAALTLVRAAVDTLGAISETLMGGRLFTRSVTDTLDPISESLTRNAQAFTRSATDTLPGGSDLLSRGLQVVRTASDALASPLDTLTRAPSRFVRGVLDALAGLLEVLTGRVPPPIVTIVARSGTMPMTVTATGTLPAVVARTGTMERIVQRGGEVT
jgi:hypothetical protein